MVSHTAPRRAGAPRFRRPRTDRDGDLLMGAAPAPARPQQARPTRNEHPKKFTEVKVAGWQPSEDEKGSLQSLFKFLNRHAHKRRPRTQGPAATVLIKSHRVEDDGTVYIQVPDETAALYLKIDGFSFMGSTLSITRPGSHRSSERTQPHAQASTPAQATGSGTNEIVKSLNDFIAKRYSPETKVLNLSAMATDEELVKSGMFDTPARQTKFFSALMRVCDDGFTSEEHKREAVQSISLAQNSLQDLNIVHPLRRTFPNIINLDLSGNAFKSTKDLQRWKSAFPHLDLLLLDNNPLITAQPGWEMEVLRWFPRLRFLNNVQVRTDEEIARLDMPKQTPNPTGEATWNDMDGVAERFLLDFYAGYDTNREALLTKYYDNDSTFSITINRETKGGAKRHDKAPWDAYNKYDRNNKSVKNPKTRRARVFRGVENITTVWKDLPATRHPSLPADVNKYKFECQPVSGIPGSVAAEIGLQVTVHGEFEEHNTARGANEVAHRRFDRVFILGPGGLTGVRVVRESLTLRPYGGVAAWEAGVEREEQEREVERV